MLNEGVPLPHINTLHPLSTQPLARIISERFARFRLGATNSLAVYLSAFELGTFLAIRLANGLFPLASSPLL